MVGVVSIIVILYLYRRNFCGRFSWRGIAAKTDTKLLDKVTQHFYYNTSTVLIRVRVV